MYVPVSHACSVLSATAAEGESIREGIESQKDQFPYSGRPKLRGMFTRFFHINN